MIGVFDSGYGGLSVLRELRAALPKHDFVYLGDSGRAPYGGRDSDTILDFAEQCVERLFEEGCRLVIVACHTVSCVALRHLQRRYASHPHGSRRILGVTIPAAEAAVASSAGHIGVIGTKRTIASNTFGMEIGKLCNHRLSGCAAPLLAPIVEEGWEASPIAQLAVQGYVDQLGDIDTLVLACTHYPLLMPEFQRSVGPGVQVLDPSPFVAERLVDWLARHPGYTEPGAGALRILCTGEPSMFQHNGARFLGSPLPTVQHVAEEGGRLALRDRVRTVVGQVVRGGEKDEGVPVEKELVMLRRPIEEFEASDLASRATNEQHLLFHKFVTASREGLGWADIEGNVRYLNPALSRMLELARAEDKYGEPVAHFYDEETQRRLAEEIFPTIIAKGMWTGELNLRSEKGRVTPTLNSLFRLNDADGNPICFANIVTDLSERKRIENELRRHRDELEQMVLRRTNELTEANKRLQLEMVERERAENVRMLLERKVHEAQKLESLGILAGGIAHDLNNLLVGVLGNAELALRSLEPKSPARARLADIVTAAKRLSEFTNQMLAYSGKGRFVVESINLSRLVEEMSHLLKVSTCKKVVIKYDLLKEPPAVECDVSQIRQVVMNLITNAYEAIGTSSGVVSLTTGVLRADEDFLKDVYPAENLAEGDYVFLEVADSGCGMNPEDIGKIFDPFFTTKATGRGLGLAAVLGIVRGHRGGIRICSETGRGTSFKLLLPPVNGAALNAHVQAGEPQRGLGTGTILVVDDESAVCDVARLILENAGYKVLVAEDGERAIAILENNKEEISAVLLDLTMPRMDGAETFGEVRRLRPNVPVILSSGYSEQDATSTFAGKGLAGFIQKPYSAAALVEKIETSLKGRLPSADSLTSSQTVHATTKGTELSLPIRAP